MKNVPCTWRHALLTCIGLSIATAAIPARTPPPFNLDPYPSTYRPLERVDTLITNAVILDGLGKRIDRGELLLRAGKVVALGTNLDRNNVTLVDANGRWVTPGIIDIHTHNGTYSMPLTSIDNEASDISETSDPNVADTWIEHAVNSLDPAFAAALASGVTTVQVLPGSVPLFSGRSVILKTIHVPDVRAMKFPGAVQGLKMSCGENAKSYFSEQDKAPNSRQGGVAMIRAALLQAQHYRDEWRAYEKGKRKVAPTRDLKLDTLAAVLDGDLPVHMHCYRASDMVAMLSVAAEFGFRIAAFHHASEAYKILPQLKAAGTCIAVWSDWWGFKMEIMDAIRENAAMAHAAGVCVMMHSDSPIIGQRLTIEAAKANGAGRRIGLDLPPEELIRWVTSTPAQTLRLGDRLGALTPGYNADVVIWSGNPFSIYSKADVVFVDGARVYDRATPSATSRPDFLLGRPEVETH